MSPSEFDLRAALRDGEDDGGPDVDELVAHVRGRRAQRRTRILSGAAVVAVVAAAGVGTAVVRSGSDGGRPQGAGATHGPTNEPADSGVQTDTGKPAVASCPSSYPDRTVPGAGTSGAASAGRVFGAPVATVLICAYTETGSATGVSAAPLTLTGDSAASLADSIETASKSKLNVACPAIASAEKKQLAIIGVTAGGTRLPTVTTDVSIPNCNQPITNGSAVRYAWKPPASVAPLISALTTSTGKTLPSEGGGTVNGSPVR